MKTPQQLQEEWLSKNKPTKVENPFREDVDYKTNTAGYVKDYQSMESPEKDDLLDKTFYNFKSELVTVISKKLSIRTTSTIYNCSDGLDRPKKEILRIIEKQLKTRR